MAFFPCNNGQYDLENATFTRVQYAQANTSNVVISVNAEADMIICTDYRGGWGGKRNLYINGVNVPWSITSGNYQFVGIKYVKLKVGDQLSYGDSYSDSADMATFKIE